MSVLLLGVASIAVRVDGTTTCPTPEHVTARLAQLVTAGTDSAVPDHALLSERGDHIEVELESGAGRLLGRRQFSRQPSCDELASAIAVAIATWEADLTGGAPEVAMAPPSLEPTRSALTFAIGAGPLATATSAGWAIGGAAQLLVGSTATRWSARITAFTTTAYADMLAPGEVSWVRHGIGAGARYRVAASDALAFDVSGDAMLGVFRASGNGFSFDGMASSFDPGVGGGASMTLDRGWWAAILDVDELVWLIDRQLEVSGVPARVDLPRHELHLNVALVVRFAK